MVEKVSALGSLEVPSALVAIQVAMSHSTVLEGTIAQTADHSEALLGRLLSLELELLVSFLLSSFGADFAHLKAKRGTWGLGEHL